MRGESSGGVVQVWGKVCGGNARIRGGDGSTVGSRCEEEKVRELGSQSTNIKDTVSIVVETSLSIPDVRKRQITKT